MEARIVVMGTPQAKGSRTQIRPGVNIEAGTAASRKRKKSWRDAQERAVTEWLLSWGSRANCFFPIAEPTGITVRYRLPIPKTRLKGKNQLHPGTPHRQKPDIDKLLRATLDPLKEAGILTDDCVIADIDGVSKRWCLAGGEGVEIVIHW